MSRIATARTDKGERLGWPTLVLALMMLLAYSYFIPRGGLSNADSHIALTRAIVDGHTPRIDRYAAGLADRSAYGGHFYTDKAPGLSLLAVPFYALLRVLLPPAFFAPDLFFVVRYLLTTLVVGLPAALFVGVLYRFLAALCGRQRAALLACGYGLGTMAWALSALLFSHLIAAMATFGAFMLLYPMSAAHCSTSSTGAREQPASAWRWGMAGTLCGLAIVCEYPAALVAAGVAAYAAYAACHARIRAPGALMRGALFVVAGLAALAPLAAYNTVIYGSPFSQGYAHLHGAHEFVAGMGHGVEGVGLPSLAALWGITFSPYRGLFILSPFLLLALPGLVAMWRRGRRAAALLCGYAAGAMLLFNSGYYFWDGGVSLGPRHMGPALLFLLFPVAYALRRPRWYRVGRALIPLSIGIVALCCVTVIIFLPGVPDPIVTLALPHLLHGPTPNNWGMLLGLRGSASLLPLAVGEGALILVLWRTSSPTRRARRVSAYAKSLPTGSAKPGMTGSPARSSSVVSK